MLVEIQLLATDNGCENEISRNEFLGLSFFGLFFVFHLI